MVVAKQAPPPASIPAPSKVPPPQQIRYSANHPYYQQLLNLKEAQVKQLLNFLNKNYLNAQRASGNASTTLPTIYYISEEQARRFFNWLDRQPPASAGNGSRAPMRSQPLLVGAHANGRNSNSNGAGQTRAVSGNGGAKPITLSYENGGSGARLESLILPEKLLQIHLSPKIIHFRIRRYDADAGGLVELPPPANEFAPHAHETVSKGRFMPIPCLAGRPLQIPHRASRQI